MNETQFRGHWWLYCSAALLVRCITYIVARCPPGSTNGPPEDGRGLQCYVFHYIADGWAKAEERCVESRGHLASVAVYDNFIQNYISSQGDPVCPKFWLGGFASHGEWSWTDGSNWSDYYEPWDRGDGKTNDHPSC